MTDISKEQGTDEQWEWLASFVWEKDTLDSLASRILNVNGFDPDQVLSAWSTADSKLRWLIWIWVRARSAQGTYLHFVAGSTSSVNELPLAAVMGIFSLPRSCRTSTERRALLEKLKVSSMPNQYWLRYRDLSDHIDKLAVLSGITREEREEIIRCVAALDGLVPRDQWYDFLQVSFPTFAWYLDGFSTGNEFVDGYFQDYRSCRVKDKTSDGLAERIHTWSVDQVLWDFTPRAAAIEAIRQGGVRVIWVDGMGVEWAGLVHSFITSHSGTSCDVSVVRAQLPTTTDANNEWVESEMPERAIDDAAHHYGYAYPRSFLDQFEAVEQICQKAINVLSQEDAVVITSDHGLSRFAAMGGEKVEPPPGAEVIAPGRYARLKDDCQVSSHKWLVDNGKAVLLTHAQFTGGGPRHGEVHGGATPEEILVPLFTIRRVGATLMPSIKALSEKIRLNPRGEGVLAIEASMPLDCLRLRVGGRSIVGEKRDELTWSFKLNGLKQGGHSGTVYWGVRRVGSISFVVTRGLVEDDMGIRGGQKS